MLSAVGRAWGTVRSAGPVAQTALELASSLLTLAFCVLVVAAYLRRGPAAATDRSPTVWLAAPAATCLPLLIPALPTDLGGTGRSLLACLLILAGATWSVWSVRHLSTCLSVVPQARVLIDTGPYRLVRHPLYLGEMVTVTGFAVRGGHWSHAVVVVLLLALQLYRAAREEALLAAQVPGYVAYTARTWRIVPGVV
jgi:protein-S-isoprenylcysteine O-methyltransferase Ste14